MSKQLWKPGNMLYPAPVVMVSCGTQPKDHNIITISWTGTICSDPPMLSISIRPERHSYKIIKESGEFVVNLVTRKLAAAADWCGVKSGAELNKFEAKNLTAITGSVVKAPIILESPVNIECQTTQIIPLGSHDMFLARVVGVQIDEQYLEASGRFRFDKTDPVCYSHGFYYALGENLSHFGFSVKKKKR
ncbi:MAG: flavin reductase family protein [Candidatus Margulisiibacteriota bacterium]|jgi:flavin reductase (DIM6/NTAB) family NADH-FMN oxidoreductase RutF